MRVKVCCIGSIEEAALAIRLGARALGLVSAMPSGPGVIAEPLIARIAASVPAGVDTFLLTSETEPDRIIRQHGRCGTSTIQLCDRIDGAGYPSLRAGLPGIRLVQVLHVAGPDTLREAATLHRQVDALLLDSGNPDRAVKELGGTGRTHDWAVSAAVVAASPIPVWLAGGLNASNVEEAIATVRPHGVDLCSGVRSQGRLNSRKLMKFMEAAGAPEGAGSVTEAQGRRDP